MFVNLLLSTVISTSLTSNADQQLDKVTYDIFQVNFVYEYHEDGEKEVKSEQGTLIVNKNCYHITFPEREIICNGKKMWNYDKLSNTVNVINEIDDEDNPLLFIVNYKNYFTSQSITQQNNVYLITMLPKDDGLDIKYLEIVCDEKFIQQLMVFNVDGSWMSIRFSYWEIKKNLPSKLFTFDNKAYRAKVVELD